VKSTDFEKLVRLTNQAVANPTQHEAEPAARDAQKKRIAEGAPDVA
jgi:hypothetical protein